MTESLTNALPDEAPDLNDEVYEDYFGFDEQKTFTLPDGKQHIYFKVMSEGDRARFQSSVNRDITVARQTGDAKISADPAAERHALLSASVTGWSLKRKNNRGEWEDAPFSTGNKGSEFEKWLAKANPKLVDDLEFAIRKANPWMQADMSVEDIDKEIDRLVELKVQVQEREKGEGSSSDK